MEILGVGPLEFLLIVLLALIILGPREMQKAGKSLGRGLNKLVKSDLWREIRQTSDKVRNLPTELMRDAELENIRKSLQSPVDEIRKTAASISYPENPMIPPQPSPNGRLNVPPEVPEQDKPSG